MLDGIYRVYLGALQRGWTPRDVRISTYRDSPSARTELSSLSNYEGNQDHAQTMDRHRRRVDRVKRLR